jgi:hypothetical protein
LIFEKNEATEIIEFLNKPIKSIYEDYIKDIDIEGFQTLKDDLNNIKKKMIEEQEENVDDYIEKYKTIDNNLLLIFSYLLQLFLLLLKKLPLLLPQPYFSH